MVELAGKRTEGGSWIGIESMSGKKHHPNVLSVPRLSRRVLRVYRLGGLPEGGSHYAFASGVANDQSVAVDPGSL